MNTEHTAHKKPWVKVVWSGHITVHPHGKDEKVALRAALVDGYCGLHMKEPMGWVAVDPHGIAAKHILRGLARKVARLEDLVKRQRETIAVLDDALPKIESNLENHDYNPVPPNRSFTMKVKAGRIER